MHLTELWERHRQHLTLRRRSSYTLTYYTATYRALWAYFDAQDDVPEAKELTVVQLRQFMFHLQERGLAEGGIDAHFRALRGVFGWAFKEELLSQDPTRRLERPSKPQRLQATLTPDEYRRMLEVAKKSDHKLRDIAVVVTLFDTGLRLAEIAGLQVPDVRLTDGHLRVIGKGNKERIVPLGLRSTEAIDRWLRKARKPRHASVQELFLNRSGSPLTRSGFSQLLADMAVRAEVPRAQAAPHAFRRAFALNYLRNGGDVFSLQHVLGHTSLEMTRKYVNLLPEDLKAAHVRVSPADQMPTQRAGGQR
ncbi:tyrosine-type recombinase/integrase [Deinococcus sp. KNUC1210]|uniref:tyrosine-type recombinase/integrase n=1 Tax=Deinococcus sp. KNUC1210 TaxID=2917691 RepID=UPI001EF017BC|nr:tyrosine-type recombinase/integrase [Deinococcus sp. KNUC1210]ULH14465.1 tyrosine-type recombinase/integrase [Deinococcus sp. KNUC1210]